MSKNKHESLLRLYEVAGISKNAQIARDLNELPSTITNWSKRGVSKEGALKAVAHYGGDANYILTGEGEMSPKPSFDELKSMVRSIENTPIAPPAPLEKTLSIVPVRGKAQMGSDGYWTEEDMPVGIGNGYLQVVNVSSLAYAIKAVGQSMFPAIRSGWYVVFDPEKELCSGEYVHVVLKNGKNMIKELISHANDMLSLLSINGMERLDFEMEEVEVLTAFVEIQPPSRLIDDIPIIENNDIEV